MVPLTIERSAVRARSRQAVAEAILARAEDLSSVLTLVAEQSSELVAATDALVTALGAGRLVLTCGNGGSAAEAQHLAGELVGRFLHDREPWPALALTTDTSILTSVANDYGFDEVFARQVAAFGQPGGVFIGFSTSGESPNVLGAAREARRRGMTVVAFTGRPPSSLAAEADIVLAAPSDSTPLAQEVHAVLLHLLCEMVESRLMALARDGGDPA
ncbi:MAG: SIS domain-containing protein [Thermomicrobiales bacterium]